MTPEGFSQALTEFKQKNEKRVGGPCKSILHIGIYTDKPCTYEASNNITPF